MQITSSLSQLIGCKDYTRSASSTRCVWWRWLDGGSRIAAFVYIFAIALRTRVAWLLPLKIMALLAENLMWCAEKYVQLAGGRISTGAPGHSWTKGCRPGQLFLISLLLPLLRTTSILPPFQDLEPFRPALYPNITISNICSWINH